MAIIGVFKMNKFETLHDVKAFIEHMAKISPRELEKSVEIAVVSQGSIGGSPTVKVSNMSFGIDWDANKLIIQPSEPLIKLTAEELADVRKSVSKAHSYHAGLIITPLIKENKEMKAFLLSLDPNILTDDQRNYVENLKKPKNK